MQTRALRMNHNPEKQGNQSRLVVVFSFRKTLSQAGFKCESAALIGVSLYSGVLQCAWCSVSARGAECMCGVVLGVRVALWWCACGAELDIYMRSAVFGVRARGAVLVVVCCARGAVVVMRASVVLCWCVQ